MAVRVGWVERAGALAQAREAHRAALCPSGGPRDALAAPPHRSAHPTRPSISDGWVGLNRLAERVGHTVARSLRERVRGPPLLGRPSTSATWGGAQSVGEATARAHTSGSGGRSRDLTRLTRQTRITTAISRGDSCLPTTI